MKDDLKILGFDEASPLGAKCRLYMINNRDGSARWIWNSQNPRPDFLRFYTISTSRARLYSIAIKMLFRLKLQHLLFRKSSVLVTPLTLHPLAPYTQNHFAIFTGTPGPNRKLVLFAQEHFIKIALNAASAALIAREKMVLDYLKSGKYMEVPRAAALGKGLLSLSDLGSSGNRCNHFTMKHAEALRELQDCFPTISRLFGKSEIYASTLRHLQDQEGKSLHLIPRYLKEKLHQLAFTMTDQELLFSGAHRDFTPWNCIVSAEKIHLYDFELAHPELPFGFDAFHFVLQQAVLVERAPWKNIKPKLKVAYANLCKSTSQNEATFERQLKAYLLVHSTYYLDLYSKQAQWHDQIAWQLQTWNDALSDLLRSDGQHRKLLIGDVFDSLQNRPYASVKFPEIAPKNLSAEADIDLLMDKTAAHGLQAYLSNHSLVEKVSLQAQSNMLSLILILENGEILALDMIWQLKRRALEFMDTGKAIENAMPNNYGIIGLSQKDIQTYLQGFYGLNGSAIPQKYHTYFEKGTETDIKFIALKRRTKALAANQGLAGWINKMNYGIDVIRNFCFHRGIIITFSGVDGAGKSTIIEHTKILIEKKLRKKVVVIRHRPSILPILSAITEGRQKAEQKAASSLPRQGTNKSAVSSLLRFGYYYLDYLLGQFYVYANHVLRGHVVLYDRYYFDFINDSLRSNIALPKWLTKSGYKLLLQPHLNFFLYADAEVILGRKKELDSMAIKSLTHDYLTLFEELESRSAGRYFSLENIQLERTLSIITAKAQSKLIQS